MRRVATVFALALLLLGAILLIQAKNKPLFTDAATFRQGLQALEAGRSKELSILSASTPPDTDSRAFHQGMRAIDARYEPQYWVLNDAFRTNKHSLENYGGTALVFGVALLLGGPFGRWALRTPPRRGLMQALMFVAPLLTIGTLVFDYSQRMARGDFSPWADVGPAMMMPFMIFGFLPIIWMGLHTLLVPEVYYRRQPLSIAWSRHLNPWLGLLALLAAVATLVAGWYGSWWWTISCLAWLYVYLCLAATRCAPHLFANQETEWPPAWNKS